jgi:hypothetical protein
MTKLLAGLLVVLVALAFALVICEVGVRLFAPQEVFGVRMERFPAMYQASSTYSAVLRPGVSVVARIVDRPYDISTNKDGYRTTTGAITTNEKVVLLGDSMTFGQGLSDGETMASRLQNATGWVVTNAGVPGWGLDQEAVWLHYHSHQFDRVFWFVFLGNDVEDVSRHVITTNEKGRVISVGDPAKYVGEDGRSMHNVSRSTGGWFGVVRPVHSWLDANSHLYVLVKGAFATLLFVGPPSSRFYVLNDTDSLVWQERSEEMVVGAVKGSSVPVIVVLLPSRLNYEDIEGISTSRLRWQQVLMENNVSVFDAYDVLDESCFFVQDGHLNEQGARRVANALAGVV